MLIEAKKILIVDDIKVVRSALINNLKNLGHCHFYQADNIEDAWDLVSKEDIDLVFSDWNMPGGDGIELLKRIRSNENDNIRYKKFIMITGDKTKAFDAMDTGANNIIHKPFKSEDIKMKIELLYA